jgi:ribonucleoside-diphosphate reductase alpha chain
VGLPAFSKNALTIIEQRYLAVRDGRRETVDEFVSRISLGNDEYRKHLIEPLNFLPNSPTLFNVDVDGGGTLSACFKFDVADTMLDGDSGIMDTATKAAMVTKWGGGVGYYMGNIRARGTLVNSTHGKAMGPVAILRFYNSMGSMLTQSGKRDAAQMGILDCRHPDIREFIHMKDDDPQSLSTFNISVALTDEFMQKALADHASEEYSLLLEMAHSAWRTGDPGVYFTDVAERDNPTPWLGRLTGTNPCGEVPLLNNEPCNLGSINLGNFVRNDQIDYELLGFTTRLATRYLDDVLDRNHFPVEAIASAALLTRKLGLGVCGWADALALLKIPYASDEAIKLLDGTMRFIREVADDESAKLGAEKGVAPCFQGTGVPYRNATRLCVAPTGSIAILMGASSGIEPHYLLNWTRTLGNGDVLTETIPVADRLGDFVPQTAMEVPWEWHVKHQATAQAHVDLAVSKTINLPNVATEDDILRAYIEMWLRGCKGGTVYRDGCRNEQVLSGIPATTVEGGITADAESNGAPVCEACGSDSLAYQEGCTDCLACGWSACSV